MKYRVIFNPTGGRRRVKKQFEELIQILDLGRGSSGRKVRAKGLTVLVPKGVE